LNEASDGPERWEISHELLVSEELVLETTNRVETIDGRNYVPLFPEASRVNDVGCKLLAEMAIDVSVHCCPNVVILNANM
jgi:hypothetical protein